MIILCFVLLFAGYFVPLQLEKRNKRNEGQITYCFLYVDSRTPGGGAVGRVAEGLCRLA